MGWFSKLFSNKQQRVMQAQAQQQLQLQQQQAAAEQERFTAELEASRESSQRQIELLRQQGEASLAQATETARLAQQQAEEANYRASQTPADSEGGAAADRKKKQLQAARGMASTIVAQRGSLGQPAVATQQLLGA